MKVKCPRCKNTMQYFPKKTIPKTKKCVYCGKSFNAKKAIVYGKL